MQTPRREREQRASPAVEAKGNSKAANRTERKKLTRAHQRNIVHGNL
jgi:hypothetical protein